VSTMNWTRWCNYATAFAGYAITIMMILSVMSGKLVTLVVQSELSYCQWLVLCLVFILTDCLTETLIKCNFRKLLHKVHSTKCCYKYAVMR